MCCHAGRSKKKAPIARLAIDHKDLDSGRWMNVMQKSHQLAYQRKQQESVLDIQQEVEFKQFIYPQSLIALKKSVKSLSKNKTLKIKTASKGIKRDLSAVARILHCQIENVINEQYLYISKL